MTFRGPAYEIEYLPIMTVGELKLALLQLDSSVADFDFLYCGRVIRSADKVLGDFIKADNLTLYTNAKGVHGGCCKMP